MSYFNPSPSVRGQRRVHFIIPTPDRPVPQPILYNPTARQPQPTYDPNQPSAFRRSSLPDMRNSSSHLQERRRRALVALRDMQKYLQEACNFQGDDIRRAISVLSISALSALIAVHNAMCKDFDISIIERDERLLKNVGIDLRTRHPAEQLAPAPVITNDFERYARIAHKKRMRREAEHRLLEFVSKQLRIPAHKLRDLPPAQREQRELDAFRGRLLMFSTERPDLVPRRRNSSVPNSPANRTYTAPQSPYTDPVPGRAKDELFPDGGDMGQLILPNSSFDLGAPATAGFPPAQPRLQRQPTPRHPSQSPYSEPSPASFAPAQSYAQPGSTSPYVAPMHAPGPFTNTHATASSPYMQSVSSSSPYIAQPHSSPYANAAPIPSTPPQNYITSHPAAPFVPTPPYAPAPHMPYGQTPPQHPVDYKAGWVSHGHPSPAQTYVPSTVANAAVQMTPGNTVQHGHPGPTSLVYDQAATGAPVQSAGGVQNYPQAQEPRNQY